MWPALFFLLVIGSLCSIAWLFSSTFQREKLIRSILFIALIPLAWYLSPLVSDLHFQNGFSLVFPRIALGMVFIGGVVVSGSWERRLKSALIALSVAPLVAWAASTIVVPKDPSVCGCGQHRIPDENLPQIHSLD